MRGWIQSKSRLYWVVIAASVILIAGVATVLPVFVLTHHARNTIAAQYQNVSNHQMAQANKVTQSFLVDINSAEDEPTRAAVHFIKG